MSENRMTFGDFVDTVKDNIKDYLPDSYRDAEVRTSMFQKLNGSYLGLQVRKEGQIAVPTINLERAFESFKAGPNGITRMDAVLHQIADQVQGDLGLETAWLQDYGQVKKSLFIRVNDALDNAESLRNLPHREMDGLAVSYHIAMEGPHGMEASVPVTYGLMESYGINENQLHADALASGQALNPPVFISMAEMMSRMTGIDAEELAPAVPDPGLMVLSNEQALYGAGSLFYPQMMDQIAERVGSNYFVLPSSVHETLILPDDGLADREALESMVQEINEMAVAPEDRLSDHVYHYDAQEHIFEKAATYEARMEEKEIAAEKAAMEAASRAAIPDASKDASKAEAGQEKSGKEDLREAPAEGDRKDISDKPLTEDRSGAENRSRAEDRPRAEDKNGREAGQERQDRKDTREEKYRDTQDKDQRKTPQKKERKSVLARLNEKKEKLKAQPKKDAPHRAKTNEIG